jgi:hypothetical protein
MVQTLPAAERKARVERFLEGVEMTSQKDKYPEFGEAERLPDRMPDRVLLLIHETL